MKTEELIPLVILTLLIIFMFYLVKQEEKKDGKVLKFKTVEELYRTIEREEKNGYKMVQIHMNKVYFEKK